MAGLEVEVFSDFVLDPTAESQLGKDVLPVYAGVFQTTKNFAHVD